MNVALPKAAPRVKWRHLSPRERKTFFQGLLFVSPWLIGFLALTVYPLVFSFYISLTRYDLIRPPVFIGLANYSELFFDDPVFWQVVYNTLYYVIFMAGLQDVPRSLYEAATVDGANIWQKFWNVTVPLCTPVILFNLLIGFINAFNEFTSAWLITNGGPANSTQFYSLFLYRQAFQFLRMGKASALAWVLFIIIVIYSALLFKTSARWVYYGGER